MKKFTAVITAIILCVVCFSFNASAAVEAVEAGGIPDGGIFALKNVGSGKFLNVHKAYPNGGGTNYTEDTNIYQEDRNGQEMQLFKFSYDSFEKYYNIIYIRCVAITETESF
ncbi:MAG: hypothetical protein E7646_05565 [Ruminococcaceae bacterium]|nr:hypothetical protein [Oscillospiraceae bacterium]